MFKDNLPHHDFIATPTISNQISKIHTDALILQLQNVKDVLQERFGIEEIALFGSYSRGEATENSDVDIAILKMDKKELFIF